ncbi:MAG: TerC family protein, partial [Bifidobacteriaceae bacterium]|nr:TerC family protein [Bifidobacteriaceae bacterium]
MEIHPVVWIVSAAVVVGVIVVDFLLHVRRPHVPSLRESATWISVYVGLSVLFGLGLGLLAGWSLGGEFFAGYLTEESLSLDNLFVFLLVISSFRVPKEAEQKVLLVGIALALVMRVAFILLGATVIEHFAAVFYIFGAFLLYTAVKLLLEGRAKVANGAAHQTTKYNEPRLVKLLRRVLPVADDFAVDRVFV